MDATFCDDWCQVSLSRGCAHDPADCVVGCEQARPPSRCEPQEQRLLACYRQATSCSLSFTNTQLCRDETSALLGCENQDVYACIDACEAHLQQLDEAHECPVLSCSGLCWGAAGYFPPPTAPHQAPLFPLPREHILTTMHCTLAQFGCSADDEGQPAESLAQDAQQSINGSEDGNQSAPQDLISAVLQCAQSEP